MLKISVIVPFNNGKKYLEKCLNNLSKIEFDDYEIILVDDFSNDDSEIIAKKYEKVCLKLTDIIWQLYNLWYNFFALLGSVHGVVLDSTEMCRALIAAVGNLKPKTK